jgi:phospholipase D1/2
MSFDRWDTPQHVLVDDPEGDPDVSTIWPGKCLRYILSLVNPNHGMIGKDYSNPRILDFHALNKPDEDMYDRSKIPRMPW